MKKLFLILAISIVALGINFNATDEVYGAQTVSSSKATVVMDGEEKDFEAYFINGSNYFKLRDLAFVLNENPKGFDAGWDANKGTVFISKNKPYTSNGTEMNGNAGDTASATRSWVKISVDEKEVNLPAYNIKNNNYFKLRDIMKICNINVDWDAKTNNVIIDTEKEYNTPSKPLDGMLVCVDPGHGYTTLKVQEQIAPNVNIYKRAFASGTSGSKYTEAQVNLAVGLMLRDKLIADGASVIMTRTGPNSTMSNAGRAIFANEAGVDMVIRIHCDGSTSKSMAGMSMLVPGTKYMSADLAAKSTKLGEITLKNLQQATNYAKSKGIIVRDDLTGFNWSKVPVILIEMGFMTNPYEDSMLSTYEYQEKLATGLYKGISEIFTTKAFL